MTTLVWTLSRPVIIKIDSKIKELTGCSHRTSDQHEIKQSRTSAISRNDEDMKKIEKFCTSRFLLDLKSMSVLSADLKNVATGMIAPPKVSVHEARQVGRKILQSMEKKSPTMVTLRKKDVAVQMPSKAFSDPVANSAVESDLIIQKLVSVCAASEIEEAFSYDLAHVSPTLFLDDGSLRPGNKADLGNLIKATLVHGAIPKEMETIVDGGLLFYTVVWEMGKTYGQILNRYVAYVKSHFPANESVHIIFDGYLTHSTKDMAHKHRNPVESLDIEFNEETILDCKRELLLSNPRNKQRFINLLAKYLRIAHYNVQLENSDADTSFVKKALELSEESHVCVVSDDTDVLILMIHHMKQPQNCVYIRQSGVYFDIIGLRRSLGKTAESLLLYHALTGCDTTSGLFGFGKVRLFKSKLLEKLPSLAGEFYVRQEGSDRVVEAGLKIISMIYSKSSDNSLDALRYNIFSSLTDEKKVGVSRKTDFRRLPPTTAAAKFHILRVYHQVQEWLFVQLNPEIYGWKLVNGKHVPIYTDKPIAPEGLIRKVTCSCKSGCGSDRCGCYKLRIPCNNLCKCTDDCMNNDQDLNNDEDSHQDHEEETTEDN